MRSLQIHPALWCIMTLKERNGDPAFRAPPADEHPRRGFAPVDTPGQPRDCMQVCDSSSFNFIFPAHLSLVHGWFFRVLARPPA